jgi:hypothetical protein
MMDEPKIIKAGRGVNLILNHYRYKKDGKYSAKQHWRCVVTGQGCRGRLHTIGEGDDLQVVHTAEHNHMADKEKAATVQTRPSYAPWLNNNQLFHYQSSTFLLHQDEKMIVFTTDTNLCILAAIGTTSSPWCTVYWLTSQGILAAPCISP